MIPEIILIVVFGGVLAVILSWIHRKGVETEARFRLLEKALANPTLDDANRALLGEVLRAEALRAQRGSGFSKIVVGLGWIALFVGFGMLVLGRALDPWNPRILTVGVAVMIAAVLAMTLPIAVREVERLRAR